VHNSPLRLLPCMGTSALIDRLTLCSRPNYFRAPTSKFVEILSAKSLRICNLTAHVIISRGSTCGFLFTVFLLRFYPFVIYALIIRVFLVRLSLWVCFVDRIAGAAFSGLGGFDASPRTFSPEHPLLWLRLSRGGGCMPLHRHCNVQ
jgi:hypothetical protein